MMSAKTLLSVLWLAGFAVGVEAAEQAPAPSGELMLLDQSAPVDAYPPLVDEELFPAEESAAVSASPPAALLSDNLPLIPPLEPAEPQAYPAADPVAPSSQRVVPVAQHSLQSPPFSVSVPPTEQTFAPLPKVVNGASAVRQSESYQPPAPATHPFSAVPPPTSVGPVSDFNGFSAQELEPPARIVSKNLSAEYENWSLLMLQRLALARSAFWLGDFATSIEVYQGLLSSGREGNIAPLHGELGNLFFIKGKAAQAAFHYHQAALILLQQNQPWRAYSLLRILSRLDSDLALDLLKRFESAR